MEPLDRALDLARDTLLPRFRSTHVPMGAEALASLGHPERVVAWTEAQRPELAPYPAAAPLTEAELQGALGDPQRLGAWVATFDRELRARGWKTVADEWIPRLLPAIGCDAAHGVIRTAHALRSLRRRTTPQRTHELAEALGFWAADYETLPGERAGGMTRLPSDVIPSLPQIPLEQQAGELIADQLRKLRDLPGFAGSVELAEPGDDVEGFVSDLARLSARLYLANAPIARVIHFIHALDGVSAVRELLPHLDANGAAEAAFYGWQTVAGLHAACGGPLELPDARTPAADEVPALVERAVEVGGAHALKFAQACLSEYALAPDPLFHACLLDMVERMEHLRDQLGLRV